MEKPDSYRTSNQTIAATMMLLGVPHPENDLGLITPAENIYTLDVLRGLGLGGKGLSFDEAVRQAVKSKKLGKATWFFKATEQQIKILNWFHEAEQKADAMDEAGKDGQIAEHLELTEEQVCKVIYYFMKARNVGLMKAALAVDPILAHAESTSEAQSGDKGTVTVKGACMRSLNASDETRQRVKI